jgi:hypothetical protein
VQHEGIDVGPELGHQEGHPLHQRPGDEVHVTRQPVELGHQHRAAQTTCGGEPRPAVQRVGALARLHLGERFGDDEAVLRGEGCYPA